MLGRAGAGVALRDNTVTRCPATVSAENAAALRGMPFLWVVGNSDPIFERGRDYAFARAPKNPKSRYIEVFAGHLTTPLAARSQVARTARGWLARVRRAQARAIYRDSDPAVQQETRFFLGT